MFSSNCVNVLHRYSCWLIIVQHTVSSKRNYS